MSGGLCIFVCLLFLLYRFSFIVRERFFFFSCLTFLFSLFWLAVYVMYDTKCRSINASPDLASVFLLKPCACQLPDGSKVELD